MKTFLISVLTILLLVILCLPHPRSKQSKIAGIMDMGEEEVEASYAGERARYEFDMLKDPITGLIPQNIHEKELLFAKGLPVREATGIQFRMDALNNYIAAGPNNVGGRTRALAYDLRYDGSTNKVIISGSVSGGIMRSTDGGANWTRVSPENDIHNVTAVVQDPRPGFQDIWYAGGGEPIGNSTGIIALTQYLGWGIWKSVNNGASWTKLSLTNFTDIPGNGASGTALELFDHPFDFVHKLSVNPVNGDLYIAAHRRLIRSKDGGASFQAVFGGTTGATPENGQMDVAITNAGRIFLAVNGGFQDVGLRGVWVSNSGDLATYSHIAGGQTLNVDSIPGWRGNAYDFLSGTTYNSRRILLSLAPSNQNVAYVLYENGLLSDNGQSEGDLFRLDINGNTFSWTNRSANMPDFPGGNFAGVDPYSVQEGYDMCITIKPTDPNFVILGGTNLYRSTDGFASTSNSSWIGGYRQDDITTQNPAIYPNSHPDMHNFAFNPSNVNEGLSADDGGLHKTTNIAAASVTWSVVNNYQTLQYYYVAIDPTRGKNNFAGGAQDNGTTVRDQTGLFGTPVADSNNHRILSGGGDGNSVGFSNITGSTQYIYYGIQNGRLRRTPFPTLNSSTEIRPANLTSSTDPPTESDFGEFVTNFKLDPDNTEDLYYVNFNRLFRTTKASTVSTNSGWTELTGVAQAINAANATGGRNIRIRAMAFSRGLYNSNHCMYIGTTPDLDATTNVRQGKIFRIDDPRNFPATGTPVDITPAGLAGNVQNIAVNPNNDNEIIAVVSNYGAVGIWWTNNAKTASPTWKNAEGNLTLPSIRSCMIVVKKDAGNNPVTEYYVGTSVGLYSAVNIEAGLLSGTPPTWQREGDNILNFAVVQSLAYRSLDNVMVVGTHGNGMYYTNLGTANFTGDVGTGFDPVNNDTGFITKVFPTITTDHVYYQVGNIATIKKMTIQVHNSGGQMMISRESAYTNGDIDLSRFSKGVYYLMLNTNDGRHRYVQKLIKR
ncbi:T9SS type A sorting domain-containing protein [Flavisolibacter ginsengisoli]|uniref:Por secretion system C-terminal sorting domain-containing protein n=1 Tax=Flavisolibacter ginsengisoli DSM 18119 TaxID=1121884 RepID=A0A1M4W010_9BACT|nr:T9SS type A sorting domain-containing protein [Flavisolibacter ginsengisoli]SHE74634.1 Por secretion system C-terminal sorting domain-containing protein [Flavisolibacter ginsengisoli DSM 18119]